MPGHVALRNKKFNANLFERVWADSETENVLNPRRLQPNTRKGGGPNPPSHHLPPNTWASHGVLAAAVPGVALVLRILRLQLGTAQPLGVVGE